MKTYNFKALWMICLMLLTVSVSFTACDNGEDVDTNQYVGGTSLNVFGPCPVARGGELRFLGSGKFSLLPFRDAVKLQISR